MCAGILSHGKLVSLTKREITENREQRENCIKRLVSGNRLQNISASIAARLFIERVFLIFPTFAANKEKASKSNRLPTHTLILTAHILTIQINWMQCNRNVVYVKLITVLKPVNHA